MGPQARADRRGRQPDSGREREQDNERRASREQRDREEQRGGDARARQQHDRLPPPVDEPAEQRPADAERDRIGAGHDTGRGERPVSRWVWTSSAMLSIASGSRATIEAANRRRALEEEAIDCMSRC